MLVKNPNDVDVKKFYCSRWFGDILINEYGLPVFGFSGRKYIFVMTERFKNAYDSIPKYKKVIEGVSGGGV